jgi:DNA-binding NarL/FixJ family response regulator
VGHAACEQERLLGDQRDLAPHACEVELCQVEERNELEVVGVAFDLDSVLAEARRLRPDVVLMDIKMPPNYAMEGSRPRMRSRRSGQGPGW